MRWAFVTCVELGQVCLESAFSINRFPVAVVTLAGDEAANKVGRINLTESCKKYGLEIIYCQNINDAEVMRALTSLDLDYLFVIGWSQLLTRRLISIPRCGCIGMHPTLLPEGRGRAPIPWAILKDLDKTGLTTFFIDEGTDTGKIISQKIIEIEKDTETATSLYEKVKIESRLAMVELLTSASFNKGVVPSVSQHQLPWKPSYWKKRSPKDGELSQNMRLAEAKRIIRALSRPYPGAYIVIDEKTIKIWNFVESVTKRVGVEIVFFDGTLTVTDYEVIN